MPPPSAMTFPTAREMTSTPYFWWLLYLRSSLDYWWICQEKVKCEDERLVKVWKDFGDLFQYDSLSDWWKDRGAYVFDNPQSEIRFLAPLQSGIDVLVDEDLLVSHPGMLCLAIPMLLDPVKASAYVLDTLINAHLLGAYSPSKAKYKIKKFDGKSKKTIVSAYQSIALQKCVLQSASDEEINRWGCYEMGMCIKLGPQETNNSTGHSATIAAIKRQKSIRSLFCQNKKSAAKYISNVEVGIFPSTQKVVQIPRWTQSQQQRLYQAIADGAWQQDEWFLKEHEFMLSENFQNSMETLSFSQKIVTQIKSFGSIETNF